MWTKEIIVRSAQDARILKESLGRTLSAAPISEQSRSDLERDFGLVLGLAETQLARESVKSYRTERTFAGSDYSVRFIATKSQPGLIERLISAVGLRGR